MTSSLASPVTSPEQAIAVAWLELVLPNAAGEAPLVRIEGVLQGWLEKLVAEPSAGTVWLAPPAPEVALPHEVAAGLEELSLVASAIAGEDAGFYDRLGGILASVVGSRIGELRRSADIAAQGVRSRTALVSPVAALGDSSRIFPLVGGGAAALVDSGRGRFESYDLEGRVIVSEQLASRGAGKVAQLTDGGFSVAGANEILVFGRDGQVVEKITLSREVIPSTGVIRLGGGRGWAFCGRLPGRGLNASVMEGHLFILLPDGRLRVSPPLASMMPLEPVELPNGNILVRFSAGVFHVFDPQGALLKTVQIEGMSFIAPPRVLPTAEGSIASDAFSVLFFSPGGKYLFVDSQGVVRAHARLALHGLESFSTFPPVSLEDGTVLLPGLAERSEMIRRYRANGEEIQGGGVRLPGALLYPPIPLPSSLSPSGAGTLKVLALVEGADPGDPHRLGVFELGVEYSGKSPVDRWVELPFTQVMAEPVFFVDEATGEGRILLFDEVHTGWVIGLDGRVLAKLESPFLPAEAPVHLGGWAFLVQAWSTGSGHLLRPTILHFDRAEAQ